MAYHFVLPLALYPLSLFANGLFANEVSYVQHEVTYGTNRNDVKGLTALQNKFIILQTWTGDPCVGFVPWSSWVVCNTDPTPRIIALNLGNGYSLTGTLPDFSSMDALETIDLSNNFLTGSIPDFLGSLPNLKELNLANNDFRGTVPTSLLNNKNLDLTVTGNVNLCAQKSCGETNTPPNTNPGTPNTNSGTPYTNSGTPYTNSGTGTPYTNSGTPYYQSQIQKTKKKSKLPIVLGIVIPLFTFFSVVVGIIAILQHKRNGKAAAAAAAVAAIGEAVAAGAAVLN